MKRIVTFPCSTEDVYRAVLDPILLSIWFDIPYACTGSTKLHLFELSWGENPNSLSFRGFVVETLRNKKIRIEKEDPKAEAYRALVLLFSETADGCEMEVAWSSPKLDSLAEAFLDPTGHSRLLMALDRFPKVSLNR